MSENLDPEDIEKYQIQNASEIAGILEKLKKRNQLIQIKLNQVKNLGVTKIIGVDLPNKTFVIDPPLNSSQKTQLQNSKAILFEVVLDKIKISFETTAVTPVTFEGRSVMQLPLPKKLLRLQRREEYRLSVEDCMLRIPIERNGAMRYVDCVLRDISGSGAGIVERVSGSINTNIGEVYENCLLMLPGVQALVVTIEIRNVQNVRRDGGVFKFIGCRFVDMSRAEAALIQRYIMKEERSRLFNS